MVDGKRETERGRERERQRDRERERGTKKLLMALTRRKLIV